MQPPTFGLRDEVRAQASHFDQRILTYFSALGNVS